MAGMRMPARYVAEMVCDRIAASKNYKGDKYTDAAAWEYYDRSRDHYILHPETRKELETCLLILRDEARTPASGISAPSCSAKKHKKKTPAASGAAGVGVLCRLSSVIPGGNICIGGVLRGRGCRLS